MKDANVGKFMGNMNKWKASSAVQRQPVEVIKLLLPKVIASRHFSVVFFLLHEAHLVQHCPV